MRKKGLLACLGLSFCLLMNSAAFAEGTKQKVAAEPAVKSIQTEYDLAKMTEMLISESVDIKRIDLDQEMMIIQNEEKLRDYEDDKENQFGKYYNPVKNLNQQLADAREMLSKTGDEASRIAMRNTINSLLLNYNAQKGKLKNYSSSYIAMMKSMENIKLQKQQASKKKADETDKLKYSFKKEYYDLVVSIRELELTKKDLENTKKQIEVEKIKVENGLSTPINVEDLERQKNSLETAVERLDNNIQMMKETMKTKLNLPQDQELKIKFSFPEYDYIKQYQLSDLLTSFREKNRDIEQLKLNVSIQKEALEIYNVALLPNIEVESWTPILEKEDQEKIKTAELDVKKAEFDLVSNQRDLDVYVKKAYYQYNESVLGLVSSLKTKKVYEQKKNILEANYAQGLISKLQYDLQEQEIERKFFEADKALISYENSKTLMEMISNGILVK